MIIPPVGGLSGGGLASQIEALTKGQSLGRSEAPALGQSEATTPGSLTSGGAESVGESGSFGSALTDAVSSLEKTQQSADSASQALAAGTVKDPEAAVATVEDAQLAMQLASQMRSKATEAIQTIFQTQV